MKKLLMVLAVLVFGIMGLAIFLQPEQQDIVGLAITNGEFKIPKSATQEEETIYRECADNPECVKCFGTNIEDENGKVVLRFPKYYIKSMERFLASGKTCVEFIHPLPMPPSTALTPPNKTVGLLKGLTACAGVALECLAVGLFLLWIFYFFRERRKDKILRIGKDWRQK